MSDSRCNPFTLTILVRKEVMYLNVHRWKYPKVCWYYLLPVSGRLWMWADECTKVACQWARPHMLPFIAQCFRNCNHQLGHFQVGVNLLSPVKTNPSGCTQNHNKEPSGPWSQLQLSKACHDPGCCCRHAHLQEKLPFQHVSHLRWKAQWDPLLPPPPRIPRIQFLLLQASFYFSPYSHCCCSSSNSWLTGRSVFSWLVLLSLLCCSSVCM